MSNKNIELINKLNTDRPTENEKLPYVKPELHELDLEGTEGKSLTGTEGTTFKGSLTTGLS